MDPIESRFKNRKVYELALTHRSWVNEHTGVRQSNERLEFLGDAVLEFVVSKELYNRFEDKEEGYLTALRANLVNTQNLYELAKKINIGNLIFLSKGEEDGGGRNNPSILADTIEAIIGGLFIDSGLDAAEDFIENFIFPEIEQKILKPLKDAKSLLQEIVQSKGYLAPAYKVIQESGPDHDKVFKIEVYVDGKPVGTGSGKNKSEAAQAAAQDALANNFQ